MEIWLRGSKCPLKPCLCALSLQPPFSGLRVIHTPHHPCDNKSGHSFPLTTSSFQPSLFISSATPQSGLSRLMPGPLSYMLTMSLSRMSPGYFGQVTYALCALVFSSGEMMVPAS